MGSSLMSCSTNDGKKQKIDNVVLIDSLKVVEKEVDSLKLNSKKNFNYKEK